VYCGINFVSRGIEQKQNLMKVILPISERKEGAEIIAQGFHNAEFMCIYDSDAKTFEWKDAAEMISQSVDISKDFEEMGIDAVICGYLPPMVWQIFSRSRLLIFQPSGDSFSDNIKLFDNNKLELFSPEEAYDAWGSCSGSSCSSCNSKTCS
jgi:predicted Fe-Mo cluster-binding NifX family protein